MIASARLKVQYFQAQCVEYLLSSSVIMTFNVQPGLPQYSEKQIIENTQDVSPNIQLLCMPLRTVLFQEICSCVSGLNMGATKTCNSGRNSFDTLEIPNATLIMVNGVKDLVMLGH